MGNISPLALATLGFLCLVIILMNVGLITFLRFKPSLKMKLPQMQKSHDMSRLIHIVQDPFGEQQKQLNELAGLVNQLDKSTLSDQDQDQLT